MAVDTKLLIPLNMAADTKEHYNYVQKFSKTVLKGFLSVLRCPYTDGMKLLHLADFTLVCVVWYTCFKGKC